MSHFFTIFLYSITFYLLFRTAAILHLSHSVPSKLCFTVTDFNSYNTRHTGTIAGADKTGGRMALPAGPGLGVTPNFDVLGEPLFLIQ